MSSEEEKLNPLFLQLVLSLQSTAWYQMGKTVSPISGEIERDLNQAKASIDLLVMLKEKTTGNLSNEEKKILDNTVYTLQMNYIDEQKKDEAETDAGSSGTVGGEDTKQNDPDKSSDESPDK